MSTVSVRWIKSLKHGITLKTSSLKRSYKVRHRNSAGVNRKGKKKQQSGVT